MKRIQVLGVIVKPTIRGFDISSKVSFELPKTYCEYLNIKPKEDFIALIRRNQEGITTIFINTKRDGDIGVLCSINERYVLTLKNYLLGIRSTDFYEISIVKYDNKRLAIKLQEIEKLPNYMTKEEKARKRKTKI